jgi:hypothetical protein
VPTPNPNKSDRAYAAGFFDGEGNIVVIWQASKKGYMFQVRVTQKSRKPLVWLQERWGGGIYLKQIINGVPCYSWNVGWGKARKFLDDVLPFLIVKRAQAELALKFAALTCGHFGKKSAEDKALCEQITVELKVLRAVGKEVA